MKAAPSIALPQIAFKLPLVNLWTAVAALDRSSYQVLSLIDEGKLRFAFNIARRDSGQRDVRILTQSLVEFQTGQPAPVLSAEADFARAIRIIFPATSHRPGGVATVRATTVVKRLCATSQHVLHLVRERSLRLVNGTVCRRGPGGSPEIEFASVVEFLRKRRLL